VSNFRVSPYAWDDRDTIEVFHCVDKACGFVTEDSSKLVYPGPDEEGVRLDDMFCPRCGSPIEIEQKSPLEMRGRR
jgi:hypothetical protein